MCGAVRACVRVPPTYASGAGLRGERGREWLCCIALEPQVAVSPPEEILCEGRA